MLKEQKVCFKRIKSKNIWTSLYIGLCVHQSAPSWTNQALVLLLSHPEDVELGDFLSALLGDACPENSRRAFILITGISSLSTQGLYEEKESKFTSFLVLKKNNFPSTWNITFQACVWTYMSVFSSWPASLEQSLAKAKWVLCLGEVAKVGLSPAGLLQCSSRGRTVTSVTLLHSHFLHLKDPTTPQNRPQLQLICVNLLIYSRGASWVHMNPHLNPEGWHHVAPRIARVSVRWWWSLRKVHLTADSWLTRSFHVKYETPLRPQRNPLNSYFPSPSPCVFPTALSLLCGREKRRERLGSLPVCCLPSSLLSSGLWNPGFIFTYTPSLLLSTFPSHDPLSLLAFPGNPETYSSPALFSSMVL